MAEVDASERESKTLINNNGKREKLYTNETTAEGVKLQGDPEREPLSTGDDNR